MRNENRELQRDVADRELAERIETMWERVRRNLWWPRVWNQLHNDGVHVDRKRVTRIRRQ